MKKTVIASIALLLAACDNEVTEVTNVYHSDFEVVDSVKDLPKCTDDNEGDQAFVKKESSARICVDGDWVPMASDAGNGDFSCKTEELKDGSGLKIVCNGDSIGVVMNGEKGDAGKDGKDGKDGSGCSIMEKTGSSMTVVCGDSTMVIELGTSATDSTATDTVDVNPDTATIATELELLEGKAQKGPFAGGSMAYLYELSDGHTLGQTGANFSARIDRSYRFQFTDLKLPSQYVMLQVEGYYKNEVTGKASDGTIRLRAISDVGKRAAANVNVLTELEIDRVFELVTHKGMTVKNAKKQALSEISAAFHIGPETFASDAEDLDILGTSNADAALLAISVLLQTDLSALELSELLFAISTDMKEDGKWDDAKTRTQIAEWAMNADLYGGLNKIRANMKNWGLSDSVPEFEKYVRIFWLEELGIGECSETNNGDIVDVSNVASTAVSLECEDGAWSIFEITFSPLYDASGIVYKVVHIGEQVWTAENMRTSFGNDGGQLTMRCNFGENANFCTNYGGLYSWEDAKRACPGGWHLPDRSDWEELIAFVGGTDNAIISKKLRSASWDEGADLYGFGALPAGYWDYNAYIGFNKYANFWSSTESDMFASADVLTISSDNLGFSLMGKTAAASVRCIKDN